MNGVTTPKNKGRKGLFVDGISAQEPTRINGKKLNVPSYSVSTGEIVGIRQQSQTKALFENLDERIKNSNIPTWLSFDIKKKEGKVVGVPKMIDSREFNLGQVFEFYSR